jgi:hypothetical protein
MVTLNGYDGSGNLNSTTRDFGAGRLNQLTTRVYSAVADTVSTTDPSGNVTATTPVVSMFAIVASDAALDY